MSVLASHLCEKISERVNFYAGKVYIRSQLQRFESTVCGLPALGSVVRQNILAQRHGKIT
jgi:hypothetical protein